MARASSAELTDARSLARPKSRSLCASRHARLTRYPLPCCRPRRATGAMEAVTGDVTVTGTAVIRGSDSCTGRDRHRACRDRRGRWSPAQSLGPRLGPRLHDPLTSLAHETLACATEAATARHVSPRSLESIPAASLSVASLVAMPRATLRPRLRSKCPKAETAPLPGSICRSPPDPAEATEATGSEPSERGDLCHTER
jgi:hypothetical protein